MALVVVLIAQIYVGPCDSSWLQMLPKTLASGKPAEVRTALGMASHCYARDWRPAVCRALVEGQGNPDARRAMAELVFLQAPLATHECQTPTMKALLKDPDPDVVILAARWLGFWRRADGASLVDPLVELLKRQNPDKGGASTATALQLLAAVGARAASAESAVVPYLSSVSSGLRLQACRAIAAMGGRSQDAVVALERLVAEERYYDTQACARSALSQVSDQPQ